LFVCRILTAISIPTILVSFLHRCPEIFIVDIFFRETMLKFQEQNKEAFSSRNRKALNRHSEIKMRNKNREMPVKKFQTNESSHYL